MSKELNDLQDLKSAFISHCRTLGCEDNYIKVCSSKFNIIEAKLKNYELERALRIRFENANYELVRKKQDNKKKLEALEIIKSKIASISFKYGGIMGNVIELQIGYDTCYMHFNANDKNFDLLREVLK